MTLQDAKVQKKKMFSKADVRGAAAAVGGLHRQEGAAAWADRESVQPDVGQKANCALIGKDALDNQLPACSAAKAKKNYKRGEARKAVGAWVVDHGCAGRV